ncbi:MAG: uroporphyrinogen decarboxylase family protein [Candidatus Omnitrophica bacterium]|nr:uroporphyrinogen decarboxylase family protein [Candidatus Omnitrophota bacterium]
MEPKERVERVLKREKVDKIPFTIYENKLPQCTIERILRNDGLCIVKRVSVYKTVYPNISFKTITYCEEGIEYVKTIIETPLGELETTNRKTSETGDFTTWKVSHIFKSPEDYKKIIFMIKDAKYLPCYEEFIKLEKECGNDVFLRGNIAPTPLHQIMVDFMGLEKFSEEWIERRDEIEKLYNVMVEKLREIYPILAESPCFAFNFGGNETGDVMGRERFEKYVIPLYYEAGEILHKKGKVFGPHLDGNNKIWADLIAKAPIDYIEAFSPYPDTDMEFEEAYNLWKDKILWINFPSSLHLSSEEKIKETVEKFIKIAKKDLRLIIGITEDIPRDRWQKNLMCISEIINKFPLL